MSSDSKLKFNTSASSKGAGASVTSETLTMPDHSENHILSVKADSSCSGEVDVELEMSPDGSNWCPAVTRTVSISAGQATSARTGNEEYVKLTPDAGEFKNKHCRGGLNFNTAGAVVTPDGSGARDLMHQHIATTKSFNYSQWFKTSQQPSLAAAETVTFAVTVVSTSGGNKYFIDGVQQSTLNLKEGSTYVFDTSDSSNSGHPLMFSTTANGSHAGGTSYTTGVTTNGVPGNSGSYIRIVVAASAPTLYYYCNNHSGMGGTANTPVDIDYKPVLFRHGGYDNFTNAKTVALTANAASSTPIENKFSSSANTDINRGTGTFNETFFDGNQNWTQAFWVKGDGSANFDIGTPTGQWFSNYVRIYSNFYYNASLGRLAWSYKEEGVGAATPINTTNFEYLTPTSILNSGETEADFASQWFLCVMTNSWDASTNTRSFTQKMITEDGRTYTGGSTSSPVTVTEATPSTYNARTLDSSGSGAIDANVCQYFIWNKTLSSSEIDSLLRTSPVGGNFKSPEDPTAISNLVAWYTFGDSSSDSATAVANIAPGSSIPDLVGTNLTYGAIANTEPVYMAGVVKTTENLAESKSTFSTTANSIDAASSGSANIIVEAGSAAATFYGASGAITNGGEQDIGKHLLGMFSPTQASSTSRWLFARSDGTQSHWKNRGSQYSGYPSINYVSSGSYVRYHNYLELSSFVSYSANDGTHKFLSIHPDVGASGYWYVYDGASLNFTKRSDNTSLPVVINNGYHCAVVYTPPADISQGIPEANVAVYINGVRIKIRTTTESGVDYVEGAAPADNLYYGDETYAANSAWAGTNYLDYGTSYKYTSHINNHMDFQRGLSESEVQSLYNNGQLLDFSNMQTSFPISLTGCVGAYDASVAVSGTSPYEEKQGFKDCSGYGKDIWVQYSSNTDATQTLLSPSLGFNASPTNTLEANFSTSANISISGWFKTTDTGTLFSNTGGAAATGFTCEVTATEIGISFKDGAPSAVVATTDVNDGEWHHIVVTKDTSQTFLIYIDGLQRAGATVTGLTDADLRGNNGFTLLGDGQQNAHATSAAATDSSKLNASLSNWSIHTELLDANAVKQLYSNGHVRNIKNLPSVNVGSIKVWWQLNDSTNPQNDLIGLNHLQYEDGASAALTSKLVNSDGATYVNGSINGNAMTMSLTKSFNFSTKKWGAGASYDTALCLSFNGFEEQAEYFAIWKCSQTVAGSTIDICDGNWHSVILSYRGKNNLSGDNVDPGDVVKFGPGPAGNLPYNWALSFDGNPLTSLNDGSGVDYVGGLNTIATDTYNATSYNVGFAIQDRHLKYQTSNTEEEYKPHAQFSAGIHEVVGVDNKNAFQGSVDETSFHSDDWWVDQAGTTILTSTYNAEKPATIFGNTTALNNRQGASTDYPQGKPYDLARPERLTTSGLASDIEGSNQYINPNRYDASSNPNGGLEGWWRWGDTPGDCSITINDVKDHSDSINARDITAFGIVTADRVDMTGTSESTYLSNRTASQGSGSASITFPQVIVENIQASICNLRQMASPVLKYLRVKFTGAGTCNLGENSVQAQINFEIKD